MTQLTAGDSELLEREFIAHRAAVLGMLRSDFRGLEDPEDLYHEAWAEALELLARGQTIERPRGLLKTIARRRAMDELRNRHTVSTDPSSQLIVGRPDVGPAVEEQAASQLDAVTLRQIVDDLDPRQATVIKLRFHEHCSGEEICARLGITQKRLEKIVKASYERVLANVDSVSGESRWRLRQRSVLLNCEIGWATAAQRARAQRMVDEDPVCRAMLREMRATLRDIAALLPAPMLVEEDRLARIPATLWDRIAVAREHLSDVLSRVPGHTQSIEQAGAGLGGAAGVGVAAKVALVCAFTAGGTVACVESGMLRDDSPPQESTRVPRRTTPPREPKPPVLSARSAPRQRPPEPRRTRSTTATSGSRSASAPPAPSPVQEGSSEFGPGAIGSTSAPTQPAAAPTGGGGEFLP